MTSISINKNINLEASATLAINERVKEMWKNGKTVYHLGFGEARFLVHSKIQEALIENADKKSYIAVQGLPELREAIAHYYGERLKLKFNAEQVLVAPGSKALLFAVQLALDADVLLVAPAWVSYEPQAQLIEKKAIIVKSNADNGFRLNFEALDEALKQCTKKKKLLIINSPNNPTGLMLEPEFLKELAEYCRKHEIIVMSDEIYGQVAHGDIPHESLAKYYPEATIIMGGLSKHLSLGGWRLGKAIIPKEMPELVNSLNAIASEIWSAASSPIQYAALKAYSTDPDVEAYIQDCVSLHGLRTKFIWEGLTKAGIRCPKPQGAFYMMPDFNAYREALKKRAVFTSIDLAQYLLEEHQIASLPGKAFGLEEDDLALRLSTSFIDLEDDAKARDILDAWQNNTPADVLLQEKHPHSHAMLKQFEAFIASLI